MTRAELIEALKSAKMPNAALDMEIARKFGTDYYAEGCYRAPIYTFSIDASVALVKRVRPGWCWNITDKVSSLFPPDMETTQFSFTAATPAIALLVALLESIDTP